MIRGSLEAARAYSRIARIHPEVLTLIASSRGDQLVMAATDLYDLLIRSGSLRGYSPAWSLYAAVHEELGFREALHTFTLAVE